MLQTFKECRRIRTLVRLLAAILLFFSSGAEALDPGPKFGPEFTFPRINEAASLALYGEHLDRHLIENQSPEAKFVMTGVPHAKKYTSPEGWGFRYAQDPGVIEVTVTPMTVSDFVRFGSNISDAIFASAYALNHYPSLYLGGGHINIDLAYFFDDPRSLRNFIVDFVNHVELSMGIFGYDTNNALPLVYSGLYEALNLVLENYRERFENISKNDPLQFRETLVKAFVLDLHRIFSSVVIHQDIVWAHPQVSKHSALSFSEATNPDGSARIEIRSVRPQWSFDIWIRQISLIRDRILYLKKNYSDVLLPLDPRPLLKNPAVVLIDPNEVLPAPEKLDPKKLNPPIDPQLALQNFYRYVNESGQSWYDHRDYMWPAWMWRQEGESRSELERFESSRWFKTQEGFFRPRRTNSCAPLLN